MLMMSTGRSTTQTSVSSRLVSAQIPQGTCSVRAPQIGQMRMRSRASVTAAAKWRTTAGSLCSKCKAMRSAERGPMPGSLFRALINCETGSGKAAITVSPEARQAQSRSDLAHLGLGNLLGLSEGLIGRGEDHILQKLRVGRVQRLRIDFYRGQRA